MEAFLAAAIEDTKFVTELGFLMKHLEINNSELSQALGVARTSINRWFKGTAIPHPLVRPAIFRVLHALCQEKALRSV